MIPCYVLLLLAGLATLLFEHSPSDISISQLFYSDGEWLLVKGAQPYAFIFYDFPKGLLILLGLLLMLTLTYRYWQHSFATGRLPETQTTTLAWPTLLTRMSSRELGYLLLTLIVIPSTIALLKSMTHVSCPNHLAVFNGDLPYLTIWQNILAQTPQKCFPAAHASAGFSLFGLAYLPHWRPQRRKIIIAVIIAGWIMGLYKMSIGDHFFSHTLVSMLLAWAGACGLAAFIFAKDKRGVKNYVGRWSHQNYRAPR